jgi:hypothetical protein
VRGREAVLLAAAVDVRELTWTPGVRIVGSCSLLVASLAPAPIAGAEGAPEIREALAPAAS